MIAVFSTTPVGTAFPFVGAAATTGIRSSCRGAGSTTFSNSALGVSQETGESAVH